MGLFDGLLGKKKTANEELYEKFKEASATRAAVSSDYAVVQVQEVYNITGIGVVPVGKVVEGVLVPGFKASIGGKIAIVKTIEAHHQQLNSASVGENIGFNLTGVQKGDIVPGMTLRFQRVL